MKNMRIITLLLTLFFVFTLITGCGSSKKTTTPSDTKTEMTPTPAETKPTKKELADKTIVIGMDQEPESLDATTVGLDLARWCSDPIFGRLVWLDETGAEIVPAIAESWTYITDTQIEFKLRKDVKFHNGRALVADDIVYCLGIHKDKDYGGTQYSYFSPYVDSIEATDDYTVFLNLKSPYPAILSIITKMPIFAPETIDTIATKPVGCGPFKFISWDKNQTLKLEAFEDYYEDGVPLYQYLTYNFYAEYNTCLTAFMAGEVDIINWMSPVDVPTIEALGDSYTMAAPASCFYFQADMNNPIFSTPGVMKAISLAVDREEMVELILDGHGGATCLPQHPTSPFYPDDIDYKPDLAKAKKLLAEAGYPNGFTCTLLAPLTAIEGVMAEVLQAQLARVGITVKLNVLEVPSFLETWKRGDFDLAICGHSYEIDPSIRLNRWMSDNPGNYGRYSNPAFDKFCNEGATTIDEAKRKQIYYDAYHIFVNDSAIIYCFDEVRYSAVRNNIEGLIKRTSFNDYTRLIIK
jgi:peptide/nickel transport system substrate-binding protein